jgi:rhodanese-related sulfurtransferase
VQAIGTSGVARRVDVISMAMQMGGTVYDLEESELCYAPQFGAAKDPVNMAGMIAGNNLRADLPLADWWSLQNHECFVLDVRSANEFSGEEIPGAVNIPIEELRDRYTELPKDTEIMVVCGVGQRAYYAVRMLLQYGYQVKMLPGGMQTYQVIKEIKKG